MAAVTGRTYALALWWPLGRRVWGVLPCLANPRPRVVSERRSCAARLRHPPQWSPMGIEAAARAVVGPFVLRYAPVVRLRGSWAASTRLLRATARLPRAVHTRSVHARPGLVPHAPHGDGSAGQQDQTPARPDPSGSSGGDGSGSGGSGAAGGRRGEQWAPADQPILLEDGVQLIVR